MQNEHDIPRGDYMDDGLKPNLSADKRGRDQAEKQAARLFKKMADGIGHLPYPYPVSGCVHFGSDASKR